MPISTRPTSFRRILAAALLAAAALALACVTNPVTGRREISFMSTAQERVLGEQAAEQVAQQIGLVDDPQLVAYVSAIGQRMARFSPRQDVTYQFAVADMPEPNAFALPGGWVYISRGLLTIANSEAELANVVGHEIAHVAARHAAQRQTRSMGVGLLSVLGAAVAGATAGGEAAQMAAQLGQVVGAGLIATYGRDQERQSDEVGQGLAAKAGYDPAEMATFLRTLERESVLRMGGERMPSFLDSHPMTAERVETTAARARTLPLGPSAPIASSDAAFLARLDGLLVGPDPAQGLFREQLFLHPGLDFAIEFPAGWKTVNQPAVVGAQSPQQDAVVMLQGQGAGGDPAAAAREFASQNQLTLEQGRSGRIDGLPAYRARASAQGQQGTVGLDLTWIAHPRGIFRVTGMASQAAFSSQAEAFGRTATSFRRPSSRERASITEQRLRIVAANRGEGISALSRRSGNAWTAAETAVANGLAESVVFRGGERVKIAVEVPWRG